MQQRRFASFRRKLLAAFGGIGILFFIILLLGNHIAGLSIQQFTLVIKNQVKALAIANELHLSIGRIRLSEVGLSKMDDYFAVITEIQRLKQQILAFEKDLNEFDEYRSIATNQELNSVRNSWKSYKKDLERVIELSSAMKMANAMQISTFNTEPQFSNIQILLKSAALKMKQAVDAAYLETELEQQQLRGSFTIVSLLGLFVGLIFVLLFSRSLSSRVTALRDAALRVTERKATTPIPVDGNDELASLAEAFNEMQQQIQSRQQALTEAHDTLELRVERRTHALYQSNQLLRKEIDQRERVEQSLRLLSKAMEQSPVGVFIADTQGCIEYVNAAFVGSSAYCIEDLIGKSMQQLSRHTLPHAIEHKLLDAINTGTEWRGEIEIQQNDSSPEWVSLQIAPIKDAAKNIVHFMAIKENVTLRKQQEQKIIRQAQFDSLTDLPNRSLAMDRLSQAMISAERTGLKIVLMFLDLDDFKKINDSLGHDMGDKLLIEAAHRLQSSVRKNDTVARQGGDEFLIILNGLARGEDAEPVVEGILKSFNRSFEIAGHDLVVTPSVGLAVFPDDGDTSVKLLRNADLAMYQAKEAGRNTFQYYNQTIHDHSLLRLEMERELRHALDRDEMELYYQPFVDVTTRCLIGAEALMRWNSRAFGLVSPNRFIGIAEQTGLIVQLGEWAMQQACQQACLWQNLVPDFLLSINVSPRQFRGGFITGTIQRSLDRSLFPANQLQIEVTEGLLIRNLPEVQEALDRLDNMGVKLAMDDFGTGYSSLSYLKNFPFHTLKIDRSFISDMMDDPDYRTIVSAAIGMGRALGLTLVAEGVETEAQLAILLEEGCDTAQGYLFGRPIPAAQFSEEWVEYGQDELGCQAR